MGRPTSRRGGALCLFAVVALIAGACSNASSGSKGSSGQTSGGPVTTYAGTDFSKHQTVTAPGVTSTEIHVGSITSKTNPLGTNVGEFNDGLKGYFDTINAKGGVWGRKLKLTSERDDQTGQNTTATEAMLTQDNVYAVFEAVELMTGAPRLAAAGIPSFGWNINAEWAGPKNFFPNIAPICFNCSDGAFGRLGPWVAQQVHAHRVALLAYNVPQSADAAKGFATSFKQFGSDVGAQVVYEDTSLPFGGTDYSAQVSQMKSKGVDLLATAMDYNGDEAVAKEMQKQGISDKVTFVHPNLYDPAFVKANAKDLEGGIVFVDIDAFEHNPQNAAVKQFVDYAGAHGLKLDEITAQGWIAGLQFVSALKAAGPNFTWANLTNAWNTEKWYTAGGWVAPIDWTFQHTDPAKGPAYQSQFRECANFVRIHSGKFEPIWDAGGSKPWVCFNGQKPNVWQKPVNLSFATNKPFNIAAVQH
ncbi:MAG: ABC transporter substrate-binding protein [Mycobacterium sp.]|nr:ABC transporter substrate-binding protein [Mycobacterium sp.]